MNKKEFVWEIAFGEPIPVKIKYENYKVNNSLAVVICGFDDDFDEVITVNLPESNNLPKMVQFVDINNFPNIGKWLEGNKIATPIGLSSLSGFCSYPAYRFNE